MAINSLFVGFPFALETVYPKYFCRYPEKPLPDAGKLADEIEARMRSARGEQMENKG